MKYFVVSDVHGFYTELKVALDKNGFDINDNNHKLIICGDLMDRGTEAEKLQEFIVELLAKDKVILNLGGLMSSHYYALRDEGIAVKLEELNVENLCNYIKEHDDVVLEADLDNKEDIYDAIRDFLCEDSQWYLGKGSQDGVICHKNSYGNDMYGDFIPLLKDVDVANIRFVTLANRNSLPQRG